MSSLDVYFFGRYKSGKYGTSGVKAGSPGGKQPTHFLRRSLMLWRNWRSGRNHPGDVFRCELGGSVVNMRGVGTALVSEEDLSPELRR